MSVAILALTRRAKTLAQRLASLLEGSVVVSTEAGIVKTMQENWLNFDGFICIMATGIVVRAIARLLSNKRIDPCVVVMDELGQHAISLLSGHLGGGNELCLNVARLTGARPVITTASDVLGLVALDVWLKDQGLTSENPQDVTMLSAKLVNTGRLDIFCEVEALSLPCGFFQISSPEKADMIISSRTFFDGRTGVFRPRELVLGIGANRGVSEEEISQAVDELLMDEGLSFLSIRNLASINIKQDETAILAFAQRHGLELVFYTRDELNKVDAPSPSAAFKATGAKAVCEPAALLSAATDNLLVKKRKWKNVTLALARTRITLCGY